MFFKKGGVLIASFPTKNNYRPHLKVPLIHYLPKNLLQTYI